MLAIRSSFAGSVIVSVVGIGACSASGPDRDRLDDVGNGHLAGSLAHVANLASGRD
jgi:hypothetical protein